MFVSEMGWPKPGKFELLVSGRITSTWDGSSNYPALQRNETNQPFVTRVCSSTNGKTDHFFEPQNKGGETETCKLLLFVQFLSLVVGFLVGPDNFSGSNC